MPLGADKANLVVELNMTGNFNKESGKAVASIKGMTKQTQSLQSQVKGSILQGVGLGAGVTGFNLLSQGISTVIGAGFDAIDMASDLEESQSKVNVVFGEGADEVTAWARAADQSLGLTEQAALEAAGTFGNFIQALGSSQEESQEMSQTLVNLAADLASFNNTDISEVILALRSGLAGEAEPMRRLGVSLSAVREESILTARGIQKVNGAFKDSDRVMARYIAIMEDTALAQGDFERTSDGLANSQRRLNAQLGDLQTQLGALLIGPMGDFVDLLSDAAALAAGTPSSAQEAFRKYTAELYGTADAMEEVTDAQKEWSASVGPIEDFVDTLPKELAPTLNAQMDLWREYGEVMTEAGFTFRSFSEENDRLVREQGLTIEAAAEVQVQFIRLQEANEILATGIAKTAREDAILFGSLKKTDGAADDAAKTFKQLAFRQYDAADAAEAAEGGFRKQRRELNRLINAAENFRRKNEQTLPRAIELIGEMQHAQRQQTNAANRGLPQQVAKWQAVQNSIQGLLGPLQSALVLTLRLQAQSALLPAFNEVAGLFGARATLPGGGGGGGGGSGGRRGGGGGGGGGRRSSFTFKPKITFSSYEVNRGARKVTETRRQSFNAL